MAGLGGFAGAHHRALARLEAAGLVHVVGGCDPMFASMQAAVAPLAARQIPVFPTLEEMLLAVHPDIVTLPVPVPLHAPMHRAVVSSGAACYLEKPPTLWWPELGEMIEVDQRSATPTRVGFNFVADPMRHSLKERLLAGEFGELKSITLNIVWPRDAAYYGRNHWAGRLRTQDHWTLDSPIGNAMAHYIQNVLYWGGQKLESVGTLNSVQASLWRIHPIQSYDTAFVRAELESGIEIRIAATHSQQAANHEIETLHLERATIVFSSWRTATITQWEGTVEQVTSQIPDQEAMLAFNLRQFAESCSGTVHRVAPTLQESRSFVALCALAFVSSAQISGFPVDRARVREGHRWVEGLDEQLRAFIEAGVWPGETPRSCKMGDLSKLAATMRSILDATPHPSP